MRLAVVHLVTGDHSPFWQQFLMNRWQQQLTWSLSCAALWVACEMVQARFLTGMPWNLLGVSQYRMIPVIQIASVVGVYGISFLMVWFSVSLISVGALMVLRPDRPRDWMIEIMPPLFIVMSRVGRGGVKWPCGARSWLDSAGR